MKCFAFTLSLVLLAVVKARVVDITRFQIEEQKIEDEVLYDFLVGRNPFLSNSRLTTYKYNNCGDSTDLANLTKLVFSPDPLSFPGTFSVSFSVDIKKTVDAPLKGVVKLERRVGSSWLTIPCIGYIGSCTYDDICEFLAQVTCPPPFTAAGVPCKCPFGPGKYTLPSASFDVSAALFPPGDYHAVANLTLPSSRVACAELYASFS